MKIFKAILISILITTISLLSGFFGWHNQFIIVGICYLLAPFFFKKETDLQYWIYSFIILLPFIVIYWSLIIYNGLIHVYPIAFISVISYSLSTIILSRIKKMIGKTILTFFLICIIVLGGVIGMPNWLSFVFNKDIVHQNTESIEDISFITSSLDTLSIIDLPYDIILLDFWSTSCVNCFKKFPELENVFKKYANNDRVGIYSVNLLMKNQNIEEVITNDHIKKYGFNKLFTNYYFANNIMHNFHFNTVPTIVIMNRRKILYQGQLYTDKKIIINNSFSIIDKALSN